MLFDEKLTALGGQDLINFLLRDDIPCPEILEENCPPEDCSMSEAAHLDEEIDDLIVSMLSSLGDELEVLQEYLLAESDSSTSEHQHLCYSPGSNFGGSCQSSEIVHIDHNYFCPKLKSRSSDTSEGDPSPELAQHARAGPVRDRAAGPGESLALPTYLPLTKLLLEQLQEPPVSGTQSTTETTAKNSSMVLLLSINLIVSSSLLSLQSEETQTEVTVLSQQISEFPDSMVVDVQEDTALELFFPDSEDPLMSISVTQSL